MKFKNVKFGLIFCFFYGITSLKVRAFHIEESDGTKNFLFLNNVRKIIFSRGVLAIQEINNSSLCDLSNLFSFKFDYLIIDNQELNRVIGANISFDPNPVIDIVHLDFENKKNECFIKVFDF